MKQGDIYDSGCGLSDRLLSQVIRKEAGEAGIELPDVQFPLIVRRGVNDFGRGVTYLLNYSGEEQEFFCPAGGTELLQDTPVQKGEMLTLKPWNLKIVEEG